MKKIIISTGIVGILLMLLLSALLYTGIVRFNYPDKKQFPIRGIDISHHQKIINWEKLRTEHLQFVFIKATEGGDWKDPLFHENWLHAEQAGVARGAYHFFTLCTSGKDQAQNFIETVPNEPMMLPPIIDFEFGGNCQSRPSQQAVLKELMDCIGEIERVYHYAPIIYITYEAYQYYLRGELPQSKIWVRDIFRSPHIPDTRPWEFWQYSNRGRLNGIETYVDLNVFHGNEAQFHRLLQKRVEM